MKEMVKTYGGTVVALFVMGGVMGAILSLILSGGLGQPMSLWLSKGTATNEFSYTGDALVEKTKEAHPEIVYHEDYEVFSQKYIPVDKCFSATDAKGKPLEITVTYIRNIHEEEVPVTEIAGKQYFYFDWHGVYQVFVKAIDANGNESSIMVKVPVNKEVMD